MQDMSCFAESKTVIKYNISKVSICNREVLIMPYYTYILECADGSLYTGYTDDLEKRLAAHNAGGGAKYTRGRRPCRLVYSEIFEEKGEAMCREWHIKHKMSREEKLVLIKRKARTDR